MRFFNCLFLLATSISLLPVHAETARYRAIWRENPSTTMVIGWDQISGDQGVLFYDTIDHGTNTAAYAFQQAIDHQVVFRSMNNTYVRLTGLQSNTRYFFVIADSEGTSERMMFQTAPAGNDPITLIAGGDSRNNWEVRVNANKMVAKLKPLAVLFGGDMTDEDTDAEWVAWFDHWQHTITEEGRLIPIVAARGNHESSNQVMVNLFDIPHPTVYYALTFGKNMLRTYTLNSEDVEGGAQAAWLESDLLENHDDVIWQFAQYHKPMRPHVSSKSEGMSEYNAWAQLFYDYGVDLVVECDSHVVKNTWPIRPSSEPEADEGFVRDDENGTIYVGEGTWGAPIRSADDAKSWTRETASFNQFKWLYVSPWQVLVKTIKYNNVDEVAAVAVDGSYDEPVQLQTWGAVIDLKAAKVADMALVAPQDGALLGYNTPVTMEAQVEGPVNPGLNLVRFFLNGRNIAEDPASPYEAEWRALSEGRQRLRAEYADASGAIVRHEIKVQVGKATIYSKVSASNHDAEEEPTGTMYMDSSDLELINDDVDQIVGVHFPNVMLPANAEIVSAYIQFVVDEESAETTDLVIRAEATGNAAAFEDVAFNISSRPATTAEITWEPLPWPAKGLGGAEQRTPDLSAIVEEIAIRGDWEQGNAMVFMFTGSGKRTAEAYDGANGSGAELVITYLLDDYCPMNYSDWPHSDVRNLLLCFGLIK